MTYRVSVTKDGELLGQFTLDGYDLTKTAAQQAVGDSVGDMMGGNHVAACASLDDDLPNEEDG